MSTDNWRHAIKQLGNKDAQAVLGKLNAVCTPKGEMQQAVDALVKDAVASALYPCEVGGTESNTAVRRKVERCKKVTRRVLREMAIGETRGFQLPDNLAVWSSTSTAYQLARIDGFAVSCSADYQRHLVFITKKERADRPQKRADETEEMEAQHLNKRIEELTR